MGKPGPAVVHVADYAASYSGTFIASLRALAEPCRRMGLRLAFALSDDVAGYPWTAELRRDGFPVHFLDSEGSLAERSRVIGAIAAREEAAIVHAHFGTYDVPAAIAALRARRRFDVVWHRHNGFPAYRTFPSVAKDAIKLRLLGRASWLVAVSAAMRDEAVEHGFPAERAYLVENGVDLVRVTTASASREALRARMGLPPSARVVLLFGWDPPRKGVDVALDAMREVAGRSDALLLLVGGQALHAFVRERRGTVPAHARIVPPRENVADLFAAADVFLSASRDEGFSYALGEALANGLPSVVSDIPAVRWARDGGVLFFPPDDVPAMARAIEDVLRWTPERRAAASSRAREFATAQLSLERWAARIAGVYRAACRRGRPVADDGPVVLGEQGLG